MMEEKYLPMDSLFPQGFAMELHGFIYALSSKTIQKGDLVMYCMITIYEETEEEVRKYIYGICQEVFDPIKGELQCMALRSGEALLYVPINNCKRLTFSVIIDKTHFINN